MISAVRQLQQVISRYGSVGQILMQHLLKKAFHFPTCKNMAFFFFDEKYFFQEKVLALAYLI